MIYDARNSKINYKGTKNLQEKGINNANFCIYLPKVALAFMQKGFEKVKSP
jgi:hypothetical protein